jgi:hypothetical protein
MANLTLIVVTMGLCGVMVTMGWHIWQGLKLKRQVDKDYWDLKAMNRAYEKRVLASIRHLI